MSVGKGLLMFLYNRHHSYTTYSVDICNHRYCSRTVVCSDVFSRLCIVELGLMVDLIVESYCSLLELLVKCGHLLCATDFFGVSWICLVMSSIWHSSWSSSSPCYFSLGNVGKRIKMCLSGVLWIFLVMSLIENFFDLAILCPIQFLEMK